MSESVQNVINQNINEATNRPTPLEKEPLPVANGENRELNQIIKIKEI